MGKDPGPLAKCQKEGDSFKKKVEKAVKDGNKTLGSKKLKDNEEQLKSNFKVCYDLLSELHELQKTVDDLAEDQEPAKVKNYDNKKQTEVGRLKTWEKHLTMSMSKLLPGDKEKEYVKQLKKDAGEESEAEDVPEEIKEEDKEEESEEDDEDEDEDENEDQKEAEKAKQKQQTDDEKDEEVSGDEDESVEEEEEEDEDDESYEEEEETEKPEVKTPKAEKKEVSEEEEEEEEEEEGEEEETEEESGEEEEEESGEGEEEGEESAEEEEEEEKEELETTETAHLFVALDDYDGAEEGDLSFKKGDILTILDTREDGWWEAENEKGEKGVVPSTYLQMYNKYEDIQQKSEGESGAEEDLEEGTEKEKRKSGKMRWDGIRKAFKETSATDVLHAMGAVPSGFRPSTLASKLQTDDSYRMKHFLSPKLSSSNLSYKDLFYDPATSKIRPHSMLVERGVSITSCRQIPLPGAGITVKGRHIRVCLFDGQNILSNIHTIRVTSVDRDKHTWNFNSKISDLMNTFQHADFFVRTDSVAEGLGILFELGISYLRTSTNESGEFSCGWVHLPLRDPNGTIINRTFDLYVNGGTPYEKGVEVDPSISRRATGNAFMSLLSGNKQPRLHVRVFIPKREQKDQMDLLPNTLVGNMSLLIFYSYYRQILTDVLLRDRLDLDSTELIHHPTLATFPDVADQHDLMKVLRDAWIEKMKTVKRSEMRDGEFMKKNFCEIVESTVYPLIHKQNMVPYKDGSPEIERDRFGIIDGFCKARAEKRSTLAILLSSEMEFTPFNMSEVSFNVIGPHCVARPTHAH